MPYDPRMLQMAQMGIGMMGPQQGRSSRNSSGGSGMPTAQAWPIRQSASQFAR